MSHSSASRPGDESTLDLPVDCPARADTGSDQQTPSGRYRQSDIVPSHPSDPEEPAKPEASGKAPPSVNSILRNTILMIGLLLTFGVLTMIFPVANALYQWELQMVDSSLTGASGPARLAVASPDLVQSTNLTDSLLGLPGIFQATLTDSDGLILGTSARSPPSTSPLVNLMQLIWGQKTLKLTREIEVPRSEPATLAVAVMLGTSTSELIGATLILLSLQAAAIVVLLSAIIYLRATAPLVAGLRVLSGWIQSTSRDENSPLPPAGQFRFAEFNAMGSFMESILSDLFRQKAELAETVGRLEAQLELNDRYIGIIDQILTISGNSVVYIDEAGSMSFFNRNENLLCLLDGIPPALILDRNQRFAGRLESQPNVQRILRKTGIRPAPGSSRQIFFDFDVELTTGRIVQFIGIDLGGGDGALMISDQTHEHAFAQHNMQKQKLESLGALSSGVAHEVNNVLAVVMGVIETELLRSTDHESRSNLTSAMGAVEQGSAVVRALLDFSRKRDICPSIEYTDDILDNLFLILRGKIGREIDVTVSVSARRARVKVDRPLLTNALLNLAINAADAIGNNGKIRLIARHADADDELPAQTPSGQPFVVFEVADDGPGIDQELHPRIMDPFFTTKPSHKGTGLGLALAHNVASQLGGRLYFRSEAGKGARFMITLPEAAAVEVTANSVSTEFCCERDSHPYKVLLIDDHRQLVDVLAGFLTRLNYDVTVRYNWKETCQLLERGADYDLVVTDLLLGDGSGFDVARKLKKTGSRSRIIQMSGNPHWGGFEASEDLFDLVVEKPITLAEFESKIRRLLQCRELPEITSS